MPLAFNSASHGEIAFGFFNIDCDMLLLERTFFFADAFCREISILAGSASEPVHEAIIPAWVIERPEDVGDLMGAIHGVRYTGFIGETYRRFPFPARPEEFRQKPEGHLTRDEFRKMIAPFGRERELPLVARPDVEEIALGKIHFARSVFHEIVAYVWRGGWPEWRDGVRPDYVLAMKNAVERSRNWATRGLALPI
ncbi:MAG: hypothetical protein V2A76_05530 [Planctomycetota bacterium]